MKTKTTKATKTVKISKEIKTAETKPVVGVAHQYELVVVYPSSENELGAEKLISEKCKKRSLFETRDRRRRRGSSTTGERLADG
ncbi:MAG: hypothetical protein UW48_C0010G0003 [Microgenomates group bacterium GW2011_GWC1_44_23]|nr:MAG: hypothetical protein UW48_C0010G0003 [Microgenomates group bacterium GW2011_GWC1_44_23]